MKKHLFLACLIMQTSILYTVEGPEIGPDAFTFIRNAATRVQIDLDEVNPSVIKEVGCLINPDFNIRLYDRLEDPYTKVHCLFRFQDNATRTFKYNGEPYTLKLTRVRGSTRFTLLGPNNQIITPHQTIPAIEQTEVSLKENNTDTQLKARDDQPTPDPEPKCTLRPHLCASFCKALCAATLTGVIVYYAFGLYNKNAKNKQQPFSQKKWALGCATVIGLGTFTYVHFNTSQ